MIVHVSDPILGTDFLREYDLSTNLCASSIVDGSIRLAVPCEQKLTRTFIPYFPSISQSYHTNFKYIFHKTPNGPLYYHTTCPLSHSHPRRMPLDKRKVVLAQIKHIMLLETTRR